jgi:hypothetical protein
LSTNNLKNVKDKFNLVGIVEVDFNELQSHRNKVFIMICPMRGTTTKCSLLVVHVVTSLCENRSDAKEDKERYHE